MIRLSKSVVGESEAEAVRAVLVEDGYLGMGRTVDAFETEIASFLGIPRDHVISVNSGTAALHLAVEAAVPRGAEVLVPSLTFVASYQAVKAAGAIPIACEADPKTGLIDLADAESRITEKTAALMPVHYASYPGDMDATIAFAQKHNLRLIDDAAHSFGCAYKGRMVGSFGDITCFSFDGIKNITCGEGGALVTHDPKIAEYARDARLLGVQKDSEKRLKGERSWEFDVTGPGYRFHMSNINAAIGRVQLSRFPEFAKKRQELAARYRQNLGQVSGVLMFETDPNGVIPHIIPVRILGGLRDAVRTALKAADIESGVHYKPNHLLSAFSQTGAPLITSETLYTELLSLPLHPELSIEDVDRICKIVIESIR